MMSTDDSQPITRMQRLKSRTNMAVARWKDFWFSPEDPFTLGIIRILTGSMLAYNLLVWGLDLQAFFSSDGLQPLAAVREFYGNDFIFSFLFYVPDQWLPIVHWSCFGIALLMCAGVCSRGTTILCYLITISYSHRVPVANFGLDQILGLLCLYLAIGPSGAALSVDSIWRRRHQKTSELQPAVGLASCRMTLRLIQIHLCVIYFWAGFAKLKGDSWWTGEAMWQVLANQEYQTIDLTWLAWIPWAPYLIAHVTVIWEVFFCVLIWNKTLRPFMLLIGTGMHFGIGAFLGMWTFGLVMTYAYFAFSSPSAWRRRLHWGAPRIFSEPSLVDGLPTEGSESKSKGVPVNNPEPSGDQTCPHVLQQADEPQFEPDGDITETPQALETTTPSTMAPDFGSSAEQTKPASLLSPSPLIMHLSSCAEAMPEIADTMLAPETAVLLVSAHSEERTALRRYFRRHDIPCKAAANSETAFSIISALKPVAIVLSGSRFRPEEMETLIEDLADAANVPILAVVSQAQRRAITNEAELPARFLLYPASPREIRTELSQLLFGDSDSAAVIPAELPPQHESGA